MILEVCANSYLSAIHAEEAGANRIELCSELAVGGITPSYGLIKQVTQVLSIPVFVLIRPRSGNFCYTQEEFEIMKHDIRLCKELGCSGIVSGVLHKDGTIDLERTKALVALSKPLSFTFHRGFDGVPDPTEALADLIEIGVSRVLTSGQEVSAEQGMALLLKLRLMANNRINILPGGGINPGNAPWFKQQGFSEIHVSGTTVDVVNAPPKVPMNNKRLFDETVHVYSSQNIIKQIVKAIK
ncbi:copper homeostasis protein CutC [Aestuariivivens sediminis]|uniref:copper homeostasis protein CutC n=1 Tax=Aestuariivivens sediminis TaxID=2913557 RepID=UPI001F58A273|nr:copper homeostasis protein CutC [Aestuariivivens sediminis]